MQESLVLPVLTCQSGREAKYVCTSKQCSLPAFICSQQCACQNLHTQCVLRKVYHLKKKILNAKRQMTQAQLESTRTVLKVYDDYIETLNSDKNHYQQALQNWCLSKDMMKFIDLANQGKSGEIKGNLIQTILSCREISIKHPQYIKEHLPDLSRSFNKARKHIARLSLSTLIDSQLIGLGGFRLLQKWMSKPFDARLLYRASESNFSTEIFKKQCSTQNTLVLVKANGKIFGGFSPLKWKENIQSDKRIFMFSITLQQKYEQKQSQKFFVHSPPYFGPVFGQRTLIISKSKDQCIFYLQGLNFLQRKNHKGIESICGVKQSHFFTIEQYQVHKLYF